jgi:hypothetical protein
MPAGDAPRRLRVDLADIVDALENGDPETSAFLDLDSGAVVFVTGETRSELEALYEEIGDAADRDSAFAGALAARELPDWLREAIVEADRVEGGLGSRYVRIEPAGSRDAYRDMEAFVETVGDRHLQALLDRAIGGRGAFRRFRDELDDHPRERERWYAFRDARARQRALDWLADEGIEPIRE